ncbi:hypothetical protein A3F03_03075 [Candidatus Roizmanbacteria bacterium RIFCSPHIGHO2_12_FULL_41_11]|uniref:Uncharacterized protein n=3 Tax=Candidatus Roizmaniibacteriota TaxID=1752723 RepID=A0A1F7JRE1_9BACT|nr:MAG: hypothetical protein A3F03_03075 [Candidatus Roizmanbacteria bacterium RIFCSPHIGHO2_12_FULL_41_11]OGK51727.1 MAG: hypothetical protein A2966_01225 [Candidatus Roizmanbacteria bacterium RIFCSPLOWO2_01_FULL_41_22]OGK58179.1 MAG: hypothetical protein A3H86_02140 [Candidatus Roizmanbacteria bacterium RIFCSPLOWO2_02_FULL_41_9]
MYNWSVDTTELKKHPEQYTIWRLEQLINYGLDGEKLKKNLLRKYWSKLRIDPHYKKYLSFLLWSNQS